VEALGKFHLEEEGQGLVEYALIMVLVGSRWLLWPG
jgi:Flp pilus assembly pilin Flp